MDTEPRMLRNEANRRYELWVGDDRVGTITYRDEPDSVVLISTRVDPAFEGRGFGSRLVHDALADIRGRGLRVVLECSFARSYVERHPEEQDLVRGQADPATASD
jgi:predicted GNAT family acetyltransferase